MGNVFVGSTFEEYKRYLNDLSENNDILNKLFLKLLKDDNRIDEVLADTSISERDFVDLIALCRMGNYSKIAGGANKAAENETDRLYAKNPWKFVEEFLQNADDCNYSGVPKIDIIIDESKSAIEFIYNEQGFSRKDIWAITAFSESTKTNGTVGFQAHEGVFYTEKTGRKGKGFKSVFSLNASNVMVHVRSNGFSFKLDNKIGRIMPVWEEDQARMDGKTHIIVELINPAFSLAEIYPEFKALFCIDNCEEIFAKSPFVFMHRMKSVHVKRINNNGIDEFTTEYIEDTEATEYVHEIELDKNKTILAGIAKSGVYYLEQYQKGYISTKLNSNKKPDISVLRYTRMVEDDFTYRNYSVIAPLLRADNDIEFTNGALFRTFPMSLHGYNMPLAIDAPFELNPDRSGIQYRDEKTDTINASEWNNIVSDNVFSKGGVLEEFLLWIRKIDGIRMDKYIRSGNILLFDDRSNLDAHGNNWVKKIDISDICRKIPVFRLFANSNLFTSLANAEIVNKNLFSWPCIDSLFRNIIGADYQYRIISDIYIGSPLFRQSQIDKDGFAEAINSYMDDVECEIGIDSQAMYDFVNKLLYPYLKDNFKSIINADSDAFKKMRIYFSAISRTDTVSIIRESLENNLRWIYDSKKHNSINRYRVIESSPVDLSVISDIVKNFFGARKLEIYFSPRNINITAKNCKCWDDACDLIEAAYHFDCEVNMLSFACLKKYVISENLDKEENAFRLAGIKEIIPEEDIRALSSYVGNVEKMVSILKKMGTKKPDDYFEVSGNYLQFTQDTLDLLKTNIELEGVLENIKKVQRDSGKKINVTYDEIKECQEKVIAFFVDNRNAMIPADQYNIICEYIQEEQRYWKHDNDVSLAILIRACSGAAKPIRNKDTKNICISVNSVLELHLEKNIASIVSKNKIGRLEIVPNESFTQIPNEEIQALLDILRPDNVVEGVLYYKGNLSEFGGKASYLKDGKGGHIYLNCDENGDYKTALQECVDKSFDTEALVVIDEMEHQYQQIKTVILEINNRTEGDWYRTYEELEKRFDDYSKKDIIGILSYFRYQGYAKAFGNASLNSEKEIEDDYRNNPWKFIYEFIQNVDDCSFSDEEAELSIELNKDRNSITFEYNEDGFTLDDIKSLTKFGDSQKMGFLDNVSYVDGVFDREKTGRKGRGFKSVFSLPGQGIVVHISSNGFNFKFVKRLGSIIPIWEDGISAPKKGTRIIVEGFDSKYLPKLTENMEKMFGISDMSSFYSTCPILYLRKLNKIAVDSCGNSFAINIFSKSKVYSEELFEINGDEIVAGIVNNKEFKKSLWERVSITVECDKKIPVFDAIRYTEMFSDNHKTRVASIFAPVMNESVKIDFKYGALYRTLPLDDNVFELPMSINAPFETNSGRSAVADTKKMSKRVINYVFDELIKGFYLALRSESDIVITKYIPQKETSVFMEYKNMKPINLFEIVQLIPILKSFSGNSYVACHEAKVLYSVCHAWENPELLAKCFSSSEKILVKREYTCLVSSRRINLINFINEHFVENLNRYLDQIEVNDEELLVLLKKNIYPFIQKNYPKIDDRYKRADKKDDLKKMAIFVFEMAEGYYLRESAQTNTIWMTGVPEGYESYGRYRNVGKSSISDIYENSSWILELQHRTISFNSAFTNTNLRSNEVKEWKQASDLIKTILYYDVQKYPKISYLNDCVLDEEFDTEINLFRDGYKDTENADILKHIIDRNDLMDIASITGKTSESDLHILADILKGMGLKESGAYFEDIGKGLYQLNLSAIALLENFCNEREKCNDVVAAMDASFRKIKAQNSSNQLRIIYEDIENCTYLVIAKIFEFEVLAGEIQRSLAREFCEQDIESESLDYIEAFFRALFILGESPIKKTFKISLNEIRERKLGECIQECKLKNLDTITLHINADEEKIVYPSEAIEKALQWLEDESKVSVTYEYYLADLSEVFVSQRDAMFLFDEKQVILDADTNENSMLEFVQKRYKGNDADFKSLVRIITQQNKLKEKWNGTKEEYVKRLSEFREATLKQRKVLFPDWENHINDSNGQSEQYVIPELLQNINDCKFAPGMEHRTLDVNIKVDKGTMILRYDEIGFDFENVYSITAVGQSSKHDASEGEKGLGFKKVFTLFEEVEIYSNGFSFKLTREKNTVPKWIGSKDKQEKYLLDGKTVMVFTAPDKYKSKLGDLLNAWKSIVNGDYVGSEVSPLFLNNIHTINVFGCEKSYSRAEMKNEFLFKSIQILPMYKKLLLENEVYEADTLIENIVSNLKLRRKCQTMESEAAVLNYLDSLTFEMALPKKVGDKHLGKGCFYSTLPTKILIDVPIFMNIPLELTTGRDGKVDSSDYNATIMKMIFTSVGEEEKSLFTMLLEEYASENREIFMTDYFAGNFDLFIREISNNDEEDEEIIKESLNSAHIFEAYDSDEMVSLGESFSVDKIICQYLMNVDLVKNDIYQWLVRHTAMVAEYKLILAKKVKDCEALEKLALDVDSVEGYFPLKDDGLDLALAYLMDEYGYEGGEGINE